MTLRLSVDEKSWRDHVRRTVLTLGDVLPVVKGNGYGFGRALLMPHAAAIARDVAVGTVHELGDVPAAMRPFVLTPVGVGIDAANGAKVRHDAVLTVAAQHDLRQLQRIGARNPVVVKVRSSMHRYGVEPSDAAALRTEVERLGHEVVAWSVHLPLTGSDTERITEVASFATVLSTDIPLHVSHVGTSAGALRDALAHRIVVRTGTALWLGDKSMLALHADVIAVRIASGGVAGYRATPVVRDARLVMVGCGSSHGVGALDDGRSPFHFARRRLAMLEAPHMHTTMLVVSDTPCPAEGDWVDVQQPLTRVHPDVVVWR
jgi:alanine racemase